MKPEPTWHAWAIAALFILLALFTVAPLLVISVPVLIDYPDHLARMWLQMELPHRDAADAHYVLDWKLIPNMAMELVVPALGRLTGLETAGRIFVAMAMLMPPLACLLLHRALHGRANLWPLASLLFTYNAVLYWGFLNYLFGLGVALLAFWLWVISVRIPAVWRAVLFAPVAALLFILHLFAFGVYGLLVLGFEVARRETPFRHALLARETVIALMQFVPAGAMWLITLRNGGPLLIDFGDIWLKVNALQAPMAFGAVPGALTMALIVPTIVAMRIGTLRVHPWMKFPLLLLGAAALAMPSWVMGSWGADMRVPVALPFVLIAGTQVATTRRRAAIFLAACATIFLVLRVSALARNWHAIEQDFAEFRTMATILPRGATLLPVLAPIPDERQAIPGLPSWLGGRTKRDYNHMATLAVIDRDAFVPNLFSGWTQISPAPKNRARFVSQDDPLSPEQLFYGALPAADRTVVVPPNRLGRPAYWLDWPGKFDYVLWIDFAVPGPVPSQLQLIATGSFFRLYRVARPRE